MATTIMPTDATRSFAILKVSLAQWPPTVPRAYAQRLVDDIQRQTQPSPAREAIVAELRLTIDRLFAGGDEADSDAALALARRLERLTARDRSSLSRLLRALGRLARR